MSTLGQELLKLQNDIAGQYSSGSTVITVSSGDVPAVTFALGAAMGVLHRWANKEEWEK